jgi:hypothetical protein
MDHTVMPFVGSEALANSLVANKHQLRARFSTLFPDVYLPKDVEPTLRQRTVGAWLWSRREGVVSGLAAAALHGTKWIDDDIPVDITWGNGRPPRGVVARRGRLLPEEYNRRDDYMQLTTAARTGYDIARWSRGDAAVARLDALGNATGVTTTQILTVAANHPGAPHVSRLKNALALSDAGAQSPKETWLRLLLIRGGYPPPETQIPVDRGGGRYYYLDMGWRDKTVAVEYDGDHHRLDRPQYVKDIRRSEEITDLGWKRVTVVAEDRPAEILRRVARAWASSVLTDRRIG